MTDFISQSGREHTNNWLKNGNFFRIPRALDVRSFHSSRYTETRPAMTVAEALTPVDSSLAIGTTPEERYLANWSIYGTAEGCGSVDLDPLNSKTGIRHRSFDSGRFVRVSFFQDATITFEQEVEVINQFRGLPATAAFSAYRLDGEVKIETDIDFGSEVISGVPYFSSNVGAYRRIIHEVDECPLGLTKIVLRIKITGNRGETVGISGVAFALGAYGLSLPYSEAMGDILLPRGAIILWAGDACPPGFRDVTPNQDGFLYQTYGDPNVMNGGTQEYPDIQQRAEDADEDDPIDPYDNIFAAKEPELQETIGDNEHFAHQKTNLFGETADEFQSQAPDSQRRLTTVDFNDKGEPPSPLDVSADTEWKDNMVRRASIIAYAKDYNVNFSAADAVPRIGDITSIKEIEMFKRQTIQNEVLPGGHNEDSDEDSPPAGGDVWRNPHRHTFTSLKVPTLPPYFTVRFCEKI